MFTVTIGTDLLWAKEENTIDSDIAILLSIEMYSIHNVVN